MVRKMKKNKREFVDIHVLQTVPPSCVNRDDTGSPKTAIYGGATRARVSSQCWKKAVRDFFRETLIAEHLGTRTKRIVSLVSDEIKRLGETEDPDLEAQRVLEAAGLTIKSIDKGTEALFFISNAQVRALAKLTKEFPEVIEKNPSKEAKDKAKQALKENPGIEIALFGRMVADDPSLNTDACTQVAHSISTHKVTTEYDYFTAIDDLAPEDNAGAGHIGTVEFHSATLYRYATVAIHELKRYLQDETPKMVCNFVDAFVRSMPTGKQNTFANRTIPDAILVTIRTDQPVNLVGAFEKPVKAGSAGDKGYVEASARALSEHAKKVYTDWLGEPVSSFVTGELLSELGHPQPLKELLIELERKLKDQSMNGGDKKQ